MLEDDLLSAQGEMRSLFIVIVFSLIMGTLTGLACGALFNLSKLYTFIAVFSAAFTILILYYLVATISGLLKQRKGPE